MTALKNTLRRARCICRTLAGREIYACAQACRPKPSWGKEHASWYVMALALLCPSLLALPAHAQRYLIGTQTYPCTAAGINSANNAAVGAGGGVIDATACAGSISMSSEIDLGKSDGSVPIRFLPPAFGTWSWSLTDGTSCGIRLYGDAYWDGNPRGLQLQSAQGVNMQGLFCADGRGLEGGEYLYTEGVSVYASSGGTFSAAPFWVVYAADNSTFKDTLVVSYVAGPAAYYQVACCGATTYNLTVNTHNTFGATPLKIGDGVRNYHMTTGNLLFIGGSFQGAGPHFHEILVNGSAFQTGIFFENCYIAGDDSYDTSTSLVYVNSPYFESHFEDIKCNTEMTDAANFCFEVKNNNTRLRLENISFQSPNTNYNFVTGGGFNVSSTTKHNLDSWTSVP